MQLSAAEYAMLVTNVQHFKSHGFKIAVSPGMDTFLVRKYNKGAYVQVGGPYKTIDECFAFVDGLISNA